MNIVFIAPSNKKSMLPKEYELILAICKKNHTVIDDYVKQMSSDITDRHKSIIANIKKTDALIVEGTTITAEISRFISVALQYHIPTLILYRENNPDIFVFESSRLLSLKRYNNENIESLLKTFFKQVSKNKLLYRFNLMLSKQMTSFVMDKSKEYDVSKADYIRNLILKDMDKKKS